MGGTGFGQGLLSQKRIPKGQKHVRRWSMSLVIRGMKVETTGTYRTAGLEKEETEVLGDSRTRTGLLLAQPLSI